MIFAPEQKMSIKDIRKAANDYGLFAPTTKWDDTAAIAEDDEDPPFLDREQLNMLNGTKFTPEELNQHLREMRNI